MKTIPKGLSREARAAILNRLVVIGGNVNRLKKGIAKDPTAAYETVLKVISDWEKEIWNSETINVFIDPGHGGSDNGAVWGNKYDYIEEDDTNLVISFLLRCELELLGYNVQLSRRTDTFVSLADRAKMANNWGADIFVSIHADAFHNTTIKGISTHVYPACGKDTINLANKIQERLIGAFKEHANRGVKRSNFYVLRKTRMPAVLVECEFISNPKTRRFLKEPENQLKIACQIAHGINQYFNERGR